MKKTKRIILGSAALFTAAAIILSYFFLLKKDTADLNDYTVIGNVNGMDIYYGELRDRMLRDRAVFLSELSKKYNVDINAEDFWETDINGKSPIELLKEQSAEKVKEYKIEQQLAVKYGIIKSNETSYKAFINLLNQKNNLRSEKIQNNEVVYGASSYDKDTFLSYVQSNMVIKIKEKLSKKGEPLYATEKQLKEYYNLIKDDYYKKAPRAEYEDIYYNFESDNSDIEAEKNKAKSIMSEVLNLIKTDNDYKNKISKNYKNIEIGTLSVSEENASDLQKHYGATYSTATALKVGEVSEITEVGLVFHIFKCISYKDGGYKPFNENQDTIVSQYTDAKFNEYIKSLLEKNKIKWNENYNKVSIQD